MNSRVRVAVIVLGLGLALVPGGGAQVGSDPEFDTSVAQPAYAKDVGPRLLFDEAHDNLHTASGRYAAFADVARHDGYRVEPWKAPFTPGALPAGAVLVVANAQGKERQDADAFTAAEAAALREWVEAGGALFLIADHAPFGAAAKQLAAAFGVSMLNGNVRDAEHQAKELPGPYFLEFRRDAGLLGSHPVMEGRGPHERVARVVTFGGQALTASVPATSLLVLGKGAESLVDPNAAEPVVTPVGGQSQALALTVGKGRVVVAGEAALFGAQLITGEAARKAGLDGDLRFGMNHPGTDNRQLLLNVLHWLSGLI